MIVADATEQRFDVRVNGMVASDSDAAAAALGHLPGALVDRPRHVIGRRSAADASAGHIDGGPGCAKLESDAASRTAARASDQHDGVVQVCQ